jgi:hypothetical protein
MKVSQGRLELAQESSEKAIKREDYFRRVSLKYAKGVAKIRPVVISALLPILDELQESAGITAEGCI